MLFLGMVAGCSEKNVETTPPIEKGVTVPRVLEMNLGQAATSLLSAKLMFNATQKATAGTPDGQVVSQAPEADALVPEGSVVELVVAGTPVTSEARVAVPRVTEIRMEDAAAQLQSAKLLFRSTTKAIAGVPVGHVAEQAPNPGALVREGSVVNLIVAVAPPSALKWVAARKGFIPSRSTAAGRESGNSLYICRGNYGGGVHPGKIRRGFGGCNIPWGGRESRVVQYEVAVFKGLAWVRATNGGVPKGAVVGGKEANGQRLYLCRAAYGGGSHPGKIRSAFGACNIPWGGREIPVRAYEVLVHRKPTVRPSLNRPLLRQ